MGKKRANATKKKQAAKKKKLSSAYGISVEKGGTIARNNGNLGASSVPNGTSHAKKQSGSVTGGGNTNNNKSSGKQSYYGKSDPEKDVGSKRPQESQSNEFQRMHASLEERSRALQARKKEQLRRRKGLRKSQRKGWNEFAGPTVPKFAPATLTLAPKSTQELVDDAANQVAQGMCEIGQRGMLQHAISQYDGMSVAPGQSSLAAAASLSWKPDVSHGSNQAQPEATQNNPYAAFGGDSDSDNEWTEKKSKVVQQFQFKAASFSFLPAAPNSQAVISGPDEIDPDL